MKRRRTTSVYHPPCTLCPQRFWDVRVLLLIFFTLLLTGCTGKAVIPRYSDILQTLDPAHAVTLGNVAPIFGTQLTTAVGSYYLVAGSREGVQRWYERQVAEQMLDFITESATTDGLHRLYRARNDGPYLEVVVQQIGPQTSLLATYEDISRRNKPQAKGSWLRRAWGFVLGQTERSLSDWLFDLLTGIARPILPVYEKVWLEPVLNFLLALRWLLRWNYGVLIIFFAICMGPITDLVRGLVTRIFARFKWGMIASAIIMFLLAGIFLAAAIWQALNGFHDTSPSGQVWLQAHIYPFWSQNLYRLAASPPGGAFLGLRLDQPNLLLIPLTVVIASLVNVSLGWSNIKATHAILEQVNPAEAEKMEWLVAMVESEEGQWSDDGCGALLRFLREGAVLAFLPLGVALYFAADKVIEVLDKALSAWDLSKLQKAIETGTGRLSQPGKKVQRWLTAGLIVLLVGWLLVVDEGALFRFESNSRVVGLLQNTQASPVHLVPTSVAPSSTSLPSRTSVAPGSAPSPTVTSWPPTTTPAPQLYRGTVNTDVLNLRAGAGTEYAVLGQLHHGDRPVVMGRNQAGDWLKITFGDSKGWISAKYVDLEAPLSALPLVQ